MYRTKVYIYFLVCFDSTIGPRLERQDPPLSRTLHIIPMLPMQPAGQAVGREHVCDNCNPQRDWDHSEVQIWPRLRYYRSRTKSGPVNSFGSEVARGLLNIDPYIRQWSLRETHATSTIVSRLYDVSAESLLLFMSHEVIEIVQ